MAEPVKQYATGLKRFIPIIICIQASLFYLYEYLIRVLPSTITPELSSSFHVSAGGIGMISASFFFGYALMQIPAGALFDRYGPRLLLTLAIGLCAIMTAAFAFTQSFPMALVARFMTGFVASFAFVGALYVGSAWLSKKRFALYVGFVQLLGCVGAIAGEAPIAYLVKRFDWHQATLLIAALGILLAVMMWLIVRNHPSRIVVKKHHQSLLLTSVFHNTQTWWIGLYGFFIWAPVTVFATLWGIPYLSAAYHYGRIEAALVTSLIWVGIAAGGPIGGWVSNHLHRRCAVLSFAGLLSCVSMTSMLYFNIHSKIIMDCLLWSFGFGAAMGMAVCFGVVRDINPSKRMGTAIGFTNMAVIAGGVLLQPLVSFSLEHIEKVQHLMHVNTYSLYSYKISFSVLPICGLGAFLVALFLIKETRCKPTYK